MSKKDDNKGKVAELKREIIAKEKEKRKLSNELSPEAKAELKKLERIAEKKAEEEFAEVEKEMEDDLKEESGEVEILDETIIESVLSEEIVEESVVTESDDTKLPPEFKRLDEARAKVEENLKKESVDSEEDSGCNIQTCKSSGRTC